MSSLNAAIVALIAIGIAAVVIETEPSIFEPHRQFFVGFDLSLGVLFSLEYLVRLWAVGEDERYVGFAGRLRYICTPMALIDLVAIAPFFIAGTSNDLFLLRITRLLRIFAMGKFGRYSRALQEFVQVLRNRKYELLVSLVLVAITMLIASSIMYFAEGNEQPEAFGSIPRALWWGVVTLSTVGYGDVYPKTVAGKMCCSLIIIAGMGLIAVPTGILAAAFSEVFSQSKRNNQSQHDNQTQHKRTDSD